MTLKDLSHKELKLLAMLYTTRYSIATTAVIIDAMVIDTPARFDALNSDYPYDKYLWVGTWFDHPVVIVEVGVISLLCSLGLLRSTKMWEHNFYKLPSIVLRKTKFRKLFKELEIQIALGSIEVLRYNDEH